jgi:hypothetical protein
LEYVRTLLSDFARTQPKYIILPAEFDKVMAHQGHEILELNRFPLRRQNFFNAWEQIRAYTVAHYVWEARIGEDAIYRRR